MIKRMAISWYQKCLPFVKEAELKMAIEKRIAELKK